MMWLEASVCGVVHAWKLDWTREVVEDALIKV